MATPSALQIVELHKTFHLGFLGALRPFRMLADKLQVKGVAYRVDAVNGISLNVEPGQVFGFLGPNGAGKTTTIKILMGLIHPSSGHATILGRPIGDREARAKIGFLPEHPYFYEHLKPLEFLDFYARMFRLTARERKEKCRALVDRVGLNHAINRPLRKFSKGMIQRIGLAQALINDPDLIVLDEPMSGLDPMGRKDVRDIIFELKERGKTVFLSSHILQDVEMICDRVSILVHGRLRSEGRLQDLRTSGHEGVSVSVTELNEESAQILKGQADTIRTVAGVQQFVLSPSASVESFVTDVINGGGRIQEITPIRRSLEEIFVAETSREAAE